MKAKYVATFLLISFSAFGFVIVDSKIPKARKLSTYHQTEFVATLEHPLSKTNNSIYCASFLYSWEAFRKGLKGAIQIDSSFHDLCLVKKSTSYINTLKKDEYSVDGNVQGNSITLRSKFYKSLPFEKMLESGHYDLIFDNKRISSFGSYGADCETIEVLYYQNDDNFIIKILSKDKGHEIILSKSERNYATMAEIISDIARKRILGQIESLDDSMRWKYAVTPLDVVDIPKLAFNIEAEYKGMEGNHLQFGNSDYMIKDALQTIGFYLNEEGAEVESEGVLTVTFAEPVQSLTPKMMLFNSPFFVMLKRSDNSNPYFGCWIANTELMP